MLVSPTRLMVIQPALRAALDFNLLSGSLDSRATFTRASAGWAFNSSGVLTSYATDVPRFDYDLASTTPKGLLVEEARTNSLRNNSNTGTVVGTPGTLPTNWNVIAAANLTTNVVAFGTENGIPYTDIQIVGTTNSTQYAISPESISQIVATNAQSWTTSAYVKLVAGSTTNITNTRLTINGRLAAGGGVAGQSGTFNHTLTSTLTRTSGTFLMSDATVARVSMEYRLIFSSGVAVDITVRLGGLQLELGAFVTNPILTTSAAVTRAADVCSIATSTFGFNDTEGTLFAAYTPQGVTGLQTAVYLDDGTNNERMGVRASSGALAGVVVDGGVSQASIADGTQTATATKVAMAYKLNDIGLSVNGSSLTPDTVATIPTVTKLLIGSRLTGSEPMSGWYARVTYYSRRLPDATLQRITT